jgi:2-C-methyl-D-erythritol 4-phosphate cytidylyltransferase
MIGAILLAAGSGSRMQGEIEDKLLHPIGSSNAFSLCCRAFLKVREIDCLVITYRTVTQLERLQNSWNKLSATLEGFNKKQVLWVQGGKERQDSVYAGLLAFPDEITHVLVHDCARPFVRAQTILDCALEVATGQAITLARPLKDTLRLRTENFAHPLNPGSTKTLNRSNHWLMETPQGAPKTWMVKGLKMAKNKNIVLTDDMAAVELLGYPIGLLEPNYPNPKITTPDDFAYAQFLFQL